MLLIGDVITGTASGATSDSFPSCSKMENHGAGVWYKFQGNDFPILVLACPGAYNDVVTADTYVSVYQGSTCGQLECLPAYHQASSCGGQAFDGGSSFAMESKGNTTYYVHISNKREQDFGSRFSLSVSAYMQATNDQCTNAGEITVDAPPVRGTIKQSISEDSNFGQSGTSMAWYRFTSRKNATLRASTWLNGTAAIYSHLAVFRGGCDKQFCLAESISLPGGGWYVDFDVVSDGSNYSVVVWGQIVGDLGFFELDIRSLIRPDNDYCEAAVRLVVDGPNVTGTLFGSTVSVDEQDSLCFGPYTESGGGVWYSFTGTGDFVEVSSYSDILPHYISIYQGDCGGSLKCLAPPTDVSLDTCYSDAKSSPVQTFEGVTYFVLVSHCLGQLHGDFSLRVSTFKTASNDVCSGAIELTIGVTFAASMDGATLPGDILDCCHESSDVESDDILKIDDRYRNVGYGGIWYYVDGSGSALAISSGLLFRGWMRVYQGSRCAPELLCPMFSFGDNGANPSSGRSRNVKFFAEEGERYYIVFLSALFDDENDFTIDVTEFEPVKNDVCEGAFPLDQSSSPIIGSTRDSLPDTITCDGNSLSGNKPPGVWYTVQGTGRYMNALIAPPPQDSYKNEPVSGHTSLNVYSGNCDILSCVAFRARNRYWFDTSEVIFPTQDNRTYYIQVAAVSSSMSGAFGLTIANVDAPPSNDLCTNATVITPNRGTIVGSTWQASSPVSFFNTSTGNRTFCFFHSNSTGVWYSLSGTGQRYAISTCSEDELFETAISVYSGSCGVMECVMSSNSSGRLCISDNGSGRERATPRARVVVLTEIGVEYLIFVHGTDYWRGSFGLTVNSLLDMPPDDR